MTRIREEEEEEDCVSYNGDVIRVNITKEFYIILLTLHCYVTNLTIVHLCLDVFYNDRHYDGGTSRRLLAALRTLSRHTTVTESPALCSDLAVLHDLVDACSARSISLLPRPPTRHVLGLVASLLDHYVISVTGSLCYISSVMQMFFSMMQLFVQL